MTNKLLVGDLVRTVDNLYGTVTAKCQDGSFLVSWDNDTKTIVKHAILVMR